ncbi:hypothetical protein [Agrobacterium tumefaciens]|uniref:hypothetical protein n=1 Tax=Agrobacterium tumefaciens TaxID=358 RepID=UPI0007123C59|nr:hypothetical protein ASD74_20185 [Rhizobium sp. Root564]NTC84149.1 hypothetical protein [Agrobacterium tumefaciens]NTD11674.1 hypothetical protein [Agrobacterium tumefaciens]
MSDENGSKLWPTIVTPPQRKIAAGKNRGAPEVATHDQVVLKPTAILGTQRERLAVSAEDLRLLSPTASKLVVDQSLALLAAFVKEKASERKAILWGQDTQKTYTDEVGNALALSQSPVLAKAQGYIARMIEILISFDVDGSVANGGILAGFLKRLNGKTDTLEELSAARGELDRLVGLMGTALDELLKLRDMIEKNIGTHDAIAIEAEAAALAALYLADHFRQSRPAISERFVERSLSLTQTLAQIRANGPLREMQLDHPIRLIRAIQNVTLVSMPDFLTSLAAVNSLSAQKGMTPTEASELNYKLREIIHQLKM